jgi:hypothetical protein
MPLWETFIRESRTPPPSNQTRFHFRDINTTPTRLASPMEYGVHGGQITLVEGAVGKNSTVTPPQAEIPV